MINQFKIEWFKAVRFWLFYIVAGLICVAAFSWGFSNFPAEKMTMGVFAEAVCDTSLILTISLVTSWFVGRDFGDRTVQNEIRIGCSRLSILITRAVTVFVISVLLHLLYIVSAVAGFSAKHGFDTSVFSVENMLWLLVVMLQVITIQSVVVLLCFLFRKTAAAISASICYTFVACNILRGFFDSELFTLSAWCLSQDSSVKLLVASSLYSVVMFASINIVAYMIFRKAEIRG